MKCSVTNNRSRNALETGQNKWLNNERKYLQTKLSDIELELYSLHLLINKTLNTHCWLDFIETEVTKFNTDKKSKLNKKFAILLTYKSRCKTPRPSVKPVPEYIKNLSTTTFTKEETDLLNKGLSFTPTPKLLNIETVVADIETSIKYQTDFTKNLVRRDVKPILRQALTNNKQTNKTDAFRIVKSLKTKDVFYLKADKGNSMVIMDKTDYATRMNEHIEMANYVNIPRNPLPRMVKAANDAIGQINRILQIPKWKLSVSNPILPRLYGLPKIHKPGNKMRPIVSNVSSPTYKISKWLIERLNQIKQPDGMYVKNTFEFVDKISSINLETNEILVSFDVVSLYPSIPIPEALECIDLWLCDSNLSDEVAYLYSSIMKLCMNQNQFQYDNKYYTLNQGTSMGHPASCFISNAFMGMFETKLAKEGKLPRVWIRYVDDVFAIMKIDDVKPTLNILNSQYPSIKFTAEIETDGVLPFLDLKLSRQDSKIDIDVYRKPSSTLRYITSDSFCAYPQKMAVFNSMVYRLCKLPLSAKNYIKELHFIKSLANINGYWENNIDTLVRKHSRKIKQHKQSTFFKNREENIRRVKFNYAPQITNKLKTVLHKHKLSIVYTNNNKLCNILGNPKEKLTEHQKSGIYSIECTETNCNGIYIGQTRRNILSRFKEHCAHIRYNRPSKSAFAHHALCSDHLGVTSDNLKLIKQINNRTELDIWESIYIQRNIQRAVNNERQPIISPLFNFLI